MHIMFSRRTFMASAAVSTANLAVAADSPPSRLVVRHGMADVDGHRIFYREAGSDKAPTVLLLHGFPTSSHMFRHLIPRLAARYHVIAPDLPGFGLTEVKGGFRFSFDTLAKIVDAFTVVKKLDRYALYVFDYGAPVGWRLAAAHPERVTAIVSQNGNAYEEGLSAAWELIQAYWKDPTPANREAARFTLRPETTRWQYLEGVKDPSRVAPEGYLLDQHFLDLPGRDEIQLDLCLDYRSNIAMYPAFHAYFRRHQPPLLAVWGAGDPLFLPAGARAFARDLPKAEIHLLEDTGHFALESHGEEIAARILDFLARQPASKAG
jgi:pimeloyl-ACP methyl ester carboxylesterase